jgi:hypothetical protein
LIVIVVIDKFRGDYLQPAGVAAAAIGSNAAQVAVEPVTIAPQL